MTPLLKSLKQAAEKATPGPWITGESESCTLNNSCRSIWCYPHNRGRISDCVFIDDAAYIAAANPETVLRLIEEYERLQKAYDALRAGLDKIVETNSVVEAYDPIKGEVLGDGEWAEEARDTLKEAERILSNG